MLLLEDLAPARQGDQLAGCSLEEADVAVDELVKLHAPRWGDPTLGELEWLVKRPRGRPDVPAEMLPVFWDGFRERYADRLGPEVHEAGERAVRRRARALHRATTTRRGPSSTATTGSTTCSSAATRRRAVAVVDWQTCALGPA